MHYNHDQEVFYRMALSLVEGIGPRISRTLIAHLGSASQVFRTPLRELMRIPDMGSIRAERVKRFKEFKKAEDEIEFALKNDVSLHTFTDSSYPSRLRECVDGPLVLFTKGEGAIDHERTVAIVGTRYASDYGIRVTEEMVSGLSELNVVTISGLAYGIDICAHRNSLNCNIPTFCVFAHGMDKVYPSQHRRIADQMLETGGWITENFSGTMPDRDNFPKRNRIIAGLSDLVIVVEAARKGGALITARFANEYNRDVMAVPGNIRSTFSEGCNLLIKSHLASLFSEISDISYIMGWEKEGSGSKITGIQKQLFIADDDPQRVVYEILQNAGDKVELHTLLKTAGMPAERVLPILLQLQLKGVIRELPGKQYRIY